jgi:MFS family permease
MISFLDKSHTTAKPGFNRWLIPPAALAVHLAIGQAYSFSVFNLPLSKLIGGTSASPDDWKLSTLGWIFSLAMAFLGLSAALFGGWLEKAGPRKAIVTSATCFATGFLVSALGVHWHNIWLIYLGYGVIGGIGLGIGYISPVKIMMMWFPDRPGMAAGMAIMGFGGGAMIGAPLGVFLMDTFKTASSPGIASTFVAMGAIYFCFMMFGAFTVRTPAVGWVPDHSKASGANNKAADLISVTPQEAMRTRQFWLLWAVLFLNVTAGIGVLSQASAMIQEMFKGHVTAAAAAGFVGLLSLFNMGGRFLWSSVSDYIGRRATFTTFMALGAVLYAAIPSIGHTGVIGFFILGYGVIMSMYGGGFATMPAYVRDLFGTTHLSIIYGRLLTAWSAAGVLGPVLFNYLREYQLAHGAAPADAYSMTMYLMSGILCLGFLCNWAVRGFDKTIFQSVGKDVNEATHQRDQLTNNRAA